MIVEEVRTYTGSERLRAVERLPIRWAVVPLFFLDALCIVLSMFAAYQLRFRLLAYQSTFSPRFYAQLVVAAVLIWEIIFAFYKLYDAEYLFGGEQEYRNVINGCTVGLVALIFYSFLDRSGNQDISRGWLAMVWCFSVVLVALARFGYRHVIYFARQRGFFTRRALVIGVNQEGREVVSQLCSSPVAGVQIVGFVDPSQAQGTDVEGVCVRGDLQCLDEVVPRLGVEELIVIPTALSREALLDIYRDWGTDDKVRIRLSSGLYELFTTGVRVKEVGFVPLLSLDRTRITGISSLTKMALDYFVASAAIVFLAPLWFTLVILVKLNSPGPAFHRRRVVGMHGRTFDAFKFRTMIADADKYLETHPELLEEWEQTGKIQNDPRITRVGRVLRRFSLDELPQLLNVLRGEMSLVGPRMITPKERRHFGRWQHNLLTVRPGMTGLWQVSGRSDLTYDERVRLDMHYIRNHTIWLDLKVILNTVAAVLTGKGAY
jgi:exopolysaccharide biosynthesis polyprenyl glycosylphosphotransferase